MNHSKSLTVWCQVGLCLAFTMLGGCNFPEPPQPTNTMPEDYATKHMPTGWWNNQEIVEEGRNLYLGRTKSNVNCAKCHGKTGIPVITSARNFRDTDNMKKYSDSHLFWRISEGVPYSTMGTFKDKLSEDEIWKLIVFVSTLGMDGFQYDPEIKDWVPTG